MKYSDDLFDVNHDLKMASITGVFCALTSAIATISNIGAAYIFISILVGNLLALKVDSIPHWVTLAVFVALCLIAGIPNLDMIVLIICILAAITDEIGHEVIPTASENRFLNLFFEYRFVMKIVVLLLAVYGAFSLWVFAFFLAFEIAYELEGVIFEKFN